MSTHKLTFLSLIGTLSFVMRLSFSFLPNVQPTTVIFLIITMTFGLKEGIIVSALSMILSNIYLGFGIWTIPQVVTYIIILILFKQFQGEDEMDLPVFTALSLLSGLLYGFIISILNIPMFGVGFFLVYYLNGVSFDIAHALGNVAFSLILYPVLVPMLEKQKVKIG